MTDHLQLWPSTETETPRRRDRFAPVRAMLGRLRRGRQERRAAARLRGLDDRILKDIGITRGGIGTAVRGTRS